MIKLTLFMTLLVASNASYVAPYINTGSSTQYRQQDNLGNYIFGYDEGHATGGTFRKETSDAWGNKVGSYGLRDADGRMRIVNYIADGHGFRATISTNEPGTVPSYPAAALFNAPVISALPASKLVTSAAYVAPSYILGQPAPLYKHTGDISHHTGYKQTGYGVGGYGYGAGYGH